MNNQKLNEVLASISDYIQNINFEGTSPPEKDTEIIIFDQEEGSLFLSGEEALNYRKILHELISCFNEDFISRGQLDNFLSETIMRSLNLRGKQKETSIKERISKEISRLRSLLLQKPKEFVVYYPVFGLSSEGLPFDFGGVSFRLFDEDCKKLFISPSQNSKQVTTRQKIIDIEYEKFVSSGPIIGKPVGELSIRSIDGDAAQNSAIKKLRLTLGVLNFLGDFIPYNNGAIYLPSEMSMENINVPIIEKNGKEKPTFGIKRVGPLGDTSMASLRKAVKTQKIDMERISKILENINRSTFEKRLISAMNWAGSARIEQVREKAFLLYAISLEAIILQDGDRNELIGRLSTRVAMLLGKKFKQRLAIRKRIKELYSIRSSIVHNGKYEVANTDLSHIRAFSMHSIFVILNKAPFNNMTKTEELLNWFDAQTLG